MAKQDRQARRLLERRERAVRGLPKLTEVLRGTLAQRHVRCGKPACHCREGPGHGPISYLSVSLGVGRTQQITIAAVDLALAERLLRNYRRTQQVLEDISTINRELLQRRLLPTPDETPSGKRPSARRPASKRQKDP